jgi:asparagine synthase (glutamine-hydrolysing)
MFHCADADLAVAVRRLSIIDLQGGDQPMHGGDGRYVLVFNGEIYNAPALRENLERNGVVFSTHHSDTEVLLQLLMREGRKALRKLNGMFAFAFFDRKSGSLLCARDRLGIKPFYYVVGDGYFAFASELKSLAMLPFVERRVDGESLFHYMSLMYVPGERTMMKGVRRLPAGNLIEYDLTRRTLRIESWWRPQFRTDESITEGEWSQRIRRALGEAVERWTLSDVPIACSLSGGLDSSSIVGLLGERGMPVSTYSLGFRGDGEEQWDELPLARSVARKWGSQHHELVLDPESLLEDLLDMVWYLDEPYAGGLPSWTVYKFMSQEVKVGLSGTGGDELFGNYGKWRPLEGGALRRLWNSEVNNQRFKKEFFERCYYLSDDDKRQYVLAHPEADSPDTSELLWGYFRESEADTLRDKLAYVDLRTQLPEEFLMMTDRLSMAHSLELRTPFLDHEFLDLVLSAPSNVRTSRRDLKGLLRRSLAPVLPAEILDAPKKGFVIPLTLWLRGRLKPLVERTLSPAVLKNQGIFKPEFYETFVKPHLEGRVDHTNRVWAALMFQLWYHMYIDAEKVVKPSYRWEDIAN